MRCDDQAWIDEWIPPGTAASPRGSRDPLLLSVDELDLSVRAANLLARSKISTIGELARMTRRELLRIPWSSARVARCVVEALAEFDLTLAADPSDHDRERDDKKEPSDE